jgi:hypothetical protein
MRARKENAMSDRLTIENGKLLLTTEEGRHVELPEEQLVEMLRAEIEPPVNGAALPDGVKFLQWRAPLLCVVHQWPAHVRQMRWITDDSPIPYGPGTQFQMRRLGIPYAITFAVYFQRGGGLHLTGSNELYFRNEPLGSRDDALGYPALLNVSKIDTPRRSRAWICTQHLHQDPKSDWTSQLGALLNHTWNGAFNRSSEHHEGASWYGASQGIHPELHPVERWEHATRMNDAFALSVPWKPAALNVGQLMDALLDEAHHGLRGNPLSRNAAARKPVGMVTRFVNFAQKVVQA